MIGYGEILQKARRLKGVTINKVAQETNITAHYIEALEAEHKGEFPGVTYLLGFLRNYAEYLGLDPDELVSVFKKLELQQSTISDELFVKKRKIPYIPIIIGAVALTGIVFGINKLVGYQNAKRKEVARLVAIAEAPSTYTLSDVPLEVTLHGDDILKVTNKEGEIFDLKVGATSSYLSLETPIGLLLVDQGEEMGLDIDGIPGAELTVFVSRLAKDDSAEGITARMLLTNTPPKTATAVATVGTETPISTPSTSTEKTSMFEGHTAHPFTLQVRFRGPTMFRYKSDNKDYIEDFFTEGEELLVQANNGIRVWMSNESTAKMEVIGGGITVQLDAGSPGKVAVQDIKWIRNDIGQYRLAVYSLE